MNDSNNPKPLPDDFGMTIPNIRLPKQNQAQNQGGEGDLPTTNLRQAPQPRQNSYGSSAPQVPPPMPQSDDFGMTMPNMRIPKQNQPPQANYDNFDMTMPNMRPPQRQQQQQPPSEADFGLTMNNYQPKAEEPDFGATMSYIPMPKTQTRPRHEDVREEIGAASVAPHVQPKREEKRKGGIPVWAIALGLGFLFFGLLILGGVAAFLLIPRETGFTLVLKGAPPGSQVFVDNTLRGVSSADGSTRILGIKADEKRAIKVSKIGCSDYNDTIIGANGDIKELVVGLDCKGEVKPSPKPNDCAEDPRVCAAESAALDALDKLKVPFTVDEWVAAMNLQVINFESNSADVPPARKRVLEKGADKFKLLTGNPVVEVGGHTDNVGNDGANQKLSESRAQAVRFILVNNGVNPKAFTTLGYGSRKPKTTNNTEEGKFQNRRIEYSVKSR